VKKGAPGVTGGGAGKMAKKEEVLTPWGRAPFRKVSGESSLKLRVTGGGKRGKNKSVEKGVSPLRKKRTPWFQQGGSGRRLDEAQLNLKESARYKIAQEGTGVARAKERGKKKKISRKENSPSGRKLCHDGNAGGEDSVFPILRQERKKQAELEGWFSSWIPQGSYPFG